MAKRTAPLNASRCILDDKRPEEDDGPKRRLKRTKVNIVQDINALDDQEFFSRYLKHTELQYDPGTDRIEGFAITHTRSGSLPGESLKLCLDLIEMTSGDDYRASTMGWDVESKQREMEDKDMHYLLAEISSSSSSSSNGNAQRVFAGFLSFEITFDSSPKVPVLYIYEIHLVEAFRKCGLARYLMDIASGIARCAELDKVMLTCFLSNTRARNFYDRYGFEKDATSPTDRRTRGKVVKVDYMIMSKSVTRT